MYTSGKFLLGLTAIVGFAARSVMPSTIQEEGDACFEIAAAMPGLKNITGEGVIHFYDYRYYEYNKSLFGCFSIVIM